MKRGSSERKQKKPAKQGRSSSAWKAVATVGGLILTGAGVFLAWKANSTANRSWVLVESMRPDTDPSFVQVIIHNTGRIPATGLRLDVITGCSEFQHACAMAEVRLMPSSGQYKRAVLGPGDRFLYRLSLPPCTPPEDTPCVTGTIIYSDTFKTDRTTPFNQRWKKDLGAFILCPWGNEAE